jgi:DNA-binding response OmpR family regulator
VDAESIVARSKVIQGSHLQSSMASREGSAEFDSQIEVLLLDSDSSTRNAAADYLHSYNMSVAVVSSEQEAVRQLDRAKQSLLILNLDSGKDDGIGLIRKVRARCSDLPIIIIVGTGFHEIDRAAALELGADDCITRPFGLRELLARIRAVLRWRVPVGTSVQKTRPSSFRFGEWHLCRRTRRLTDAKGTAVPLTRHEYNLLVAFLDAPQRPLSREYLKQTTHLHDDCLDRSIDVSILRLRRKLEINANAPRVIQTERGVGYVFALAVESCDSSLEERLIDSR